MTDAPKTPSHFYIWRNEPNGEWVISDPQTPYPADAIRAIPLPDDAEMVERIGRRLCAEKCAFYGDPPCWKMAPEEGLEWSGDLAFAGRCDEDCIALARAALSAMRGEP